MAPPLPPKEAQAFKNVLKLYETKQFKKGVKQCDVILKKFPEHGETLAMKGLLLNCLGKKEDGYGLVKLGLRRDLHSHVCWHVFGLLHRFDRNYSEAIKCYRNALKIDKDNIQILRDLSLLQVQTRDYEGLKDTRQQLVTLRPQQQANWIGLAVAYHHLNLYDMAVNVLEAYEDTLKQRERELGHAERYERSELTLYKVTLLREAGDAHAAMEMLLQCQSSVVDRLAWLEQKGKVLEDLGRLDEARDVLSQLIDTNPDQRQYYLAIEQLIPAADLIEFYTDITAKHPRAMVPRRRVLDLLWGEPFQASMQQYMTKMIRKGAYSLFASIKDLYASAEKAAVIGQLAEDQLKTFKDTGRLMPNEDTHRETDTDLPTCRLWLEYFLGQHYERLGQLDNALVHVNNAIEHTPTFLELYVLRGRISQHAGAYTEAADWLNKARELDTADRYLNCKCAKYLLKANRIAEAQAAVSLFLKEGGDQLDALVDMQCMWYALAAGNSHMRQKHYGKALKKFHQIDKHFADINDDQFDFHTYCLRKVTLRAYTKFLQYEDQLYGNKYYRRAAKGAIQCYLDLYDRPPGQPVAANEKEPGQSSELSEKERKRLRSKQRKEAARKEKDKESNKEEGKPAKPRDTDPDGVALASTKQPLEEAMRFLKPLLSNAADDIQTHLLAAQIYQRKEKYLLVLKALKAAQQLDASHPELHLYICIFSQSVAQVRDLHPVTRNVIESELPILLGGKTADEFNADFLVANKECPLYICYGAQAMSALSSDRAKEAASLLLATKDKLQNCSVKDAEFILATLKGRFGDEEMANQFAAAAHETFPYAEAFQKQSVTL